MHKVFVPFACLSIALFAGCEALDINEEDAAQAVNNTAAPAAENTTASGNDATNGVAQSDASTAPIRWLGPNLSGAVIDGTLSSARVSDRMVALSYSVSWPTSVPKGMGSEMQGMACMFRNINGTLVGGKFEWFRRGQTAKTLDNIYSGYNGHTVPSRGETVYFCLTNVSGTRRTPLVASTWQ